MNGHFAAVGDGSSDPSPRDYEHGIQVIDENKDFKSVSLFCIPIALSRRASCRRSVAVAAAAAAAPPCHIA